MSTKVTAGDWRWSTRPSPRSIHSGNAYCSNACSNDILFQLGDFPMWMIEHRWAPARRSIDHPSINDIVVGRFEVPHHRSWTANWSKSTNDWHWRGALDSADRVRLVNQRDFLATMILLTITHSVQWEGFPWYQHPSCSQLDIDRFHDRIWSRWWYAVWHRNGDEERTARRHCGLEAQMHTWMTEPAFDSPKEYHKPHIQNDSSLQQQMESINDEPC